MKTHNVYFQVSLNDGSTLQEGSSILTEIQGELSPWQKLLAHLEKNRLHIASLVLVTSDSRTFNLPSLGKNPNFKPFRDAQKPIGYKVFRAIGTERNWNGKDEPDDGVVKDWYTVAEAEYPEYKLQLWVNEMDSRNCWTLATPKI